MRIRVHYPRYQNVNATIIWRGGHDPLVARGSLDIVIRSHILVVLNFHGNIIVVLTEYNPAVISSNCRVVQYQFPALCGAA